jgi:hypothetical protein
MFIFLSVSFITQVNQNFTILFIEIGATFHEKYGCIIGDIFAERKQIKLSSKLGTLWAQTHKSTTLVRGFSTPSNANNLSVFVIYPT